MVDQQFSEPDVFPANTNKKVLVFGARSDIGFFLLPHLIVTGWTVFAFTRHPHNLESHPEITWVGSHDFQGSPTINSHEIPFVISLMPIWALSDYQQMLELIHAKFLIAFSSTSIIAKETSTNPAERKIANSLQRGENWIIEEFSVGRRSALIFRPTIIYGGPHNRSVNRIRKLIKIFRFFLLEGDGKGYRQPVHAEDLSRLCLSCLKSPTIGTRIYTLAGGQILSYREMILAIFISAGLKPRIFSISVGLLRFLMCVVRMLPNQRDITPEMVTRMEQDLSCNDDDAANELGWKPRVFSP